MGIGYMMAALGVVPALLVLFHRLSRTPPRSATGRGRVELVDRGDGPGPAGAGEAGRSVAEEAERWLQSQG